MADVEPTAGAGAIHDNATARSLNTAVAAPGAGGGGRSGTVIRADGAPVCPFRLTPRMMYIRTGPAGAAGVGAGAAAAGLVAGAAPAAVGAAPGGVSCAAAAGGGTMVPGNP